MPRALPIALVLALAEEEEEEVEDEAEAGHSERRNRLLPAAQLVVPVILLQTRKHNGKKKIKRKIAHSRASNSF